MSRILQFDPGATCNSRRVSEHRASESRTEHQGGAPRLMLVVTDGRSADLVKGQLSFFRRRGFDVTLTAAPHARLDEAGSREQVRIAHLPMTREIQPLSDVIALFRLWRLMRRLRPEIVNASTPKAGLLGMLASFLARVPVRIYTLRGLRLETTQGIKRWVLALAERIASACAQRVICISQSLAHEALRLGLVDPSKVVVLGSGSSNGIDVSRFDLGPRRAEQGELLRLELGIPSTDPVVGYVGRLARDKGIDDLVEAFRSMKPHVPNAWLLLVGDLDATHPSNEATLEAIRSDPRILSTGHVGDPAPYYQAMNVFAFPSYREGFGNALIEAQAAGLPVVAYRATGVVDAIVDGVTGCLVSVGGAEEMALALTNYLQDSSRAEQHGLRGRDRVRREFTNERVWNALLSEYVMLLTKSGPLSNAAAPTTTQLARAS